MKGIVGYFRKLVLDGVYCDFGFIIVRKKKKVVEKLFVGLRKINF